MQNDLFLTGNRFELPMPDATVDYFPGWLNSADADQLFLQCQQKIEWEKPTLRVAGKFHVIPREQCWIGDPNAVYRYSQKTFSPMPWPEYLLQNKRLIESAFGCKFNSVLLNRYCHGLHGMGFHSDDEPELGAYPCIASLSLGGARTLVFRHKTDSALKLKLPLQHGDLLVMSGNTQQYWLHGIPKTQKYCAERINLTYRKIHA